MSIGMNEIGLKKDYVYKRSSIQTRWHELFQPASMEHAFELQYDIEHVRAFTYILSCVLAEWHLQF